MHIIISGIKGVFTILGCSSSLFHPHYFILVMGNHQEAWSIKKKGQQYVHSFRFRQNWHSTWTQNEWSYRILNINNPGKAALINKCTGRFLLFIFSHRRGLHWPGGAVHRCSDSGERGKLKIHHTSVPLPPERTLRLLPLLLPVHRPVSVHVCLSVFLLSIPYSNCLCAVHLSRSPHPTSQLTRCFLVRLTD